MSHKTDFLVIGSGIAGLSYALKVAEHGKVTIVTKATKAESNTLYAQGGLATVMYEPDTIEKHVQDTLICGDGLCSEEVVRLVMQESHERVQELISWGTQFDKDDTGRYDLTKEGGHSENRVLHHKDVTGREIERALLEKVNATPNIDFLPHHYVIDLITQHHKGVVVTSKTKGIECYGAYILNEKTGKVATYLSKITLLAAGGAGNVYTNTTNPSIATGDGIAMAYRAKAQVVDMEFIQFHPTAFYNPEETPRFLITEAMRGHGAILKTQDGSEFMLKYDERLSLAPRDIVARAIDRELKIRGEDFVYLDCTSISAKEIEENFPTIKQKMLAHGIDITKDFIPVAPASHYVCGGIQVDTHGRSNIKRLFASGECSRTGLHGANRLASNSLLEGLVFSHRSALKSIEALPNHEYDEDIPQWNIEGTADPEEMILITQAHKEVQSIMTNYVGIVRSNIRLKRALDRLQIIHKETEELYQKTTVSVRLCELRNMILAAYIIIKQASARIESVGLHYSTDYPKA